MRIARCLMTSLISSLLLASHAHAAEAYVPSSPYQQGSCGADSAASTPLPNENGGVQTLWLFGDSDVTLDYAATSFRRQSSPSISDGIANS